MNSSAAARLCRQHLQAAGGDVDPGTLADILWLSLQLTLRGACTPDETVGLEDLESAQIKRKSGAVEIPDTDMQRNSAAIEDNAKPDPLVPVYPSYFTHPFGKVGASHINIPAGESLPQRLSLERALKPFKRRFPSFQQRELDPIATAEASAEWRIITPVYRASAERWFEVAILAEMNDAMHVWDATLLELCRMLARHGAFRRVRLWRFTMRKESLILLTPNAVEAAPKILVDPQSRRLCWFVTTGTSVLWQHAALLDLVAMLGRYGPTAIVQLMPYHTWPHTLLGDASEEAISDTPGTPTARLRLRDPFTGEVALSPDALTLPVTSLEPARLETWARFSTASRRVSHPAIRLEAMSRELLSPTISSSEESTPRRRISAFRAIASPPAFQLLRLLSGMPLSLPVMRLMQMGMPERAQGHLAEVLLSGLIERITPPNTDLSADLVEYDFVPGVREELLDSLTVSEGNCIDTSVSQISEQARRFVEAYAGSSSATFQVLVRDPKGDERMLELAKSFLSVSQNIGVLSALELSHSKTDHLSRHVSPSPVTRNPSGFDFLSEEALKEHVLRAGGIVVGTSKLRCLLFFTSEEQRSWLVVSDHGLAWVLDDVETRRAAQLVQRTSSWFDALPVAVKRGSEGESVVYFGGEDTPGWYYSSSLFSSPLALENAIITMVPGGQEGTMLRLRGLALEYDEIRLKIKPSGKRTSRMQDIVDRMASMPHLLDPDLSLATLSGSAGVQLVAVVNLQHDFKPDLMEWLFNCIEDGQAFLAFQAAVALHQAAPKVATKEQIRMRDLAIQTKHKLRISGLKDANVHHLLDNLIEQPDSSRSSVESGGVLRFVIGSIGWELSNYRAEAVVLLESLGHEILDAPPIDSTAELQVKLDQIGFCDVILLLVGTGTEYGQAARLSESSKLLLVEYEYLEAVRLNKPIMIFMLKDDASSASSHDGEVNLMTRFRERLLKNHVVSMMNSPEHFHTSLHRALQEYSRTINRGGGQEGASLSDGFLDSESIADSRASILGKLNGGDEVDESALVDLFGEFVRLGKIPDLNKEIKNALEYSIESAQWIVDAQSSFYYEPDDEYGELVRWEFAAPRPEVFELSKYSKGTLFVTSTIVASIDVHCTFIFSVKDYVDKDMVPMGTSRISKTVKVEVEVEIGVRGIQDGLPEVESVEIESISKRIDFGGVEPDLFDGAPEN